MVDDCRVVAAQLAAMSAQDPVWLWWLFGRLEQDVGEWRLRSGPVSRRVLRLAVWVYQCGGVTAARRLRTEVLTLARMAPIGQRIGGRLFDQYRYTAAWAELETALAIGTRAGTDPGPTASSAMAARRARALAGRP